MRTCYHQSCDTYSEARKNTQRYEKSLKFLTTTTQALVLTILELTTTPNEDDSHLGNGYTHSSTNNSGKEDDALYHVFVRGKYNLELILTSWH